MQIQKPPFVVPFEGEYQPPYTFQEWTVDLIPYAKHHFNTIPYQEGIDISSSPLWISLIVFLCFAAIAYVRSYHRKRFNLLQRTLFNWKTAKQIIRYEKVYTHPVNLILIGVFVIATPSFFSFSLSGVLPSEKTNVGLIFWIGLPLAIYLVSKLLLHKFFAWLFKAEEPMEEYIFQASLFNKLFGILNLVLLTFLLYSNINSITLIQLSLAALFMFLGVQIIRGLLIGVQKGISILLIILYLCTLEILPWLMIGKMIENQF
jgi:hypothetical protein